MAKCFLRECRAVRSTHSLAISETVSMKKPPTGKPCAGKPPARFGGRGGESHSDPYRDGYRFEAGVRTVRKKSVDKLKDAIRSKTRRTRGESLEVIVTDLNRTLRGWFGYFRQAHSRIFVVLDKIIRRRLRALLRKREKRPGRGRSHDDQRRWPNAYFAEAGLFALHAAWQSARRPR